MIKEIVFDCFGVLTQDGWLAFLQQYATDENIEDLRYLNHQADRATISYDDLIEGVSRLTGAEKSIAHTMITANHQPNEEVFKIIVQLKSAYQLGIISNVGAELSNYLPAELLENFRVITLSYSSGWLKPEPQIYLKHLEESGFEPSEVVFIDDRQSNVDGARAVGMESVCFHDATQLTKELRTLGIKI